MWHRLLYEHYSVRVGRLFLYNTTISQLLAPDPYHYYYWIRLFMESLLTSPPHLIRCDLSENLDLMVSKNQASQKRSTPTRRRRPGLNQVYCIVRVYILLTKEIGVRFFIDPWRFREDLLEFGTTDKSKVTASNIDFMRSKDC